MKPRIFIFSLAYKPLIGGAEVFVEEITKRLSPLFDFYIITGHFFKKNQLYSETQNVKICRTGFGNKWLDKILYPIFSFLKARKLSKKKLPILAHGIMLSYGGLGAYFFSKWFHLPLFISEQSGDIHTIAKNNIFVYFFYRKICKQAKLIHSISNYIKKEIIKNVPDAPPIVVIPNGIEPKEFKIEKKRTSSNIEIICIARLFPIKGVSDVIKSMAIVIKQVSNIKLTIIGDGPERKNLNSLINSLKLNNKIYLAGAMSHSKIPMYLAKSSIFVCASRFEGLGNVFIEAQASGIPVIGTNVGGIPDIIEDKVTGLLVPPRNPDALASAIISIIKNPKMASNLVTNARQRLPYFFWDNIADKIKKIYDSFA